MGENSSSTRGRNFNDFINQNAPFSSSSSSSGMKLFGVGIAPATPQPDADNNNNNKKIRVPILQARLCEFSSVRRPSERAQERTTTVKKGALYEQPPPPPAVCSARDHPQCACGEVLSGVPLGCPNRFYIGRPSQFTATAGLSRNSSRMMIQEGDEMNDENGDGVDVDLHL
ncbi:hypothetical protein OSB04_009786 [Centaurea solstitialis]|uniref:Uncharacterized protein n=1 Tax=Centaurea solstitialis TaxID=347529 RepID=A0AA38WB95_9ASTR|nr:hypothetical protein OSB04_009786 [Centaurea solstitialis]